MRFRFSFRYFLLAVLIFVMEVLIALYVRDGFVRPYVGDFLVVMLLYCGVRAFVEAPALTVALGVLGFAYGVETLQYFQVVKRLGWEHSRLANVVIGNYFSWSDMAAYTLGIACTVALEAGWRGRKQPSAPAGIVD